MSEPRTPSPVDAAPAEDTPVPTADVPTADPAIGDGPNTEGALGVPEEEGTGDPVANAATTDDPDSGDGDGGAGGAEDTDNAEPVEDDPAPAAAPAVPLAATADRVLPLGDVEAVERAVTAVRDGECIVAPTDTVYGIGADAFSASAVQRLLDAKGRGRDMPPPVLIAEPAVMMALATDVPDRAKDLASEFWPGALTLILKAQPSLMMDLGETGGTIAVRVPDHDELRELLRRTGPLAVSSANASGQPAATDVDNAREQLGQSVSVYLDGGATDGDAPSTIVDFTRGGYGRVLRRGAISIDRLREVIPFLDDVPQPAPAAPEPAPYQTSAEFADQAADDPGPKHPFGADFGSRKLGSTAVTPDTEDDAVTDSDGDSDEIDRLPDGTPAAGTAAANVTDDTAEAVEGEATDADTPDLDRGGAGRDDAGGAAGD